MPFPHSSLSHRKPANCQRFLQVSHMPTHTMMQHTPMLRAPLPPSVTVALAPKVHKHPPLLCTQACQGDNSSVVAVVLGGELPTNPLGCHNGQDPPNERSGKRKRPEMNTHTHHALFCLVYYGMFVLKLSENHKNALVRSPTHPLNHRIVSCGQYYICKTRLASTSDVPTHHPIY